MLTVIRPVLYTGWIRIPQSDGHCQTNSAHTFLADQFKDRTVKKKHIGLTWGLWDNPNGEINEPLLRDKKIQQNTVACYWQEFNYKI